MLSAIGLGTLFGIGIGFIPGAMDTESVYWVNGVYYDDTGKQLERSAAYFNPTTAKSATQLLRMQRG